MNISLLQYTPQIKERILQALDYYSQKTSVPFETSLIASVRDYCVSGKMMRGNVLIHTALSLGYTGSLTALIQAAAAVEIIGSGILILDDVIDKDQERRGVPAIHVHWSAYAQKSHWSDPLHQGNAIALCLDTSLILLGMQLLTTEGIPTQLQGPLAQVSSDILVRLGLAEAHELQVAENPTLPTLEKIEQMYIDKTANYTVVWSLLAAGVLANVSAKIERNLEAVGQQIGILFQIRDDWLNLYGDPTIIGKSTLSDITNKKKTWILAQLWKQADSSHRVQISQFLQEKNSSPASTNRIVEEFQDRRFVEYLDAAFQERVSQTRDLLTSASLPTSCTNLLSELLTFVVEREK